MDHSVTVSLEMQCFLRSLLVGLPCGLLFDLCRTLRALLPHHFIAVFLEDTLCAFLCCFFVQCYAWSFCGGILRWQYLAGTVIGLCIYLLTVGAVWKRILQKLSRFCHLIPQKISSVFVRNPENTESDKKNP